MKILIIEDHPDLATSLQQQLIRRDYAVDIAVDAKTAVGLLSVSHYDVLLLDLGLPDIDGLQLLEKKRLSGDRDIPCIVVTAQETIETKIRALDAGADDYILKPFNMDELEARLRAVLRRPGSREENQLAFGNLQFEMRTRELSSPDASQTLARREAMLLRLLLNSAPQVLIKDQLEERLYGFNEEVSTNAVEALVSRTRRKLREVKANCHIETIRGLGYRLSLCDL